MELIAFSEVFEFQKKSKIKAGDGLSINEGEYPFYTSSNILSKSINEFQFEGDSLIFGTGGQASIHFCNNRFSVSTDCFVTKPKNIDLVYTKFVYYYLAGNIHILEKGFKGAGLKHISKDYLQKIQIPLPPLEEQKAIAARLDKADEIRQLNQQIINHYDELIQALFIDMFGDPVKNESWNEVKIEELAEDKKGAMRTGPFGSDLLHSEFTEFGISVLGIDNAVENKFTWKQRRYISQEKYESLKRYTIYPNDIIITIMGTVGKVAVIPDNIGLAINTKHLAALTLDKSKANPYFVAFSLYSDPFVLRQITKNGRGAIMTGLNLGIIKNIKLRLPPLELQNFFADLKFKIEAQKELAVQALQQSENLFNSLLQEAFKK